VETLQCEEIVLRFDAPLSRRRSAANAYFPSILGKSSPHLRRLFNLMRANLLNFQNVYKRTPQLKLFAYFSYYWNNNCYTNHIIVPFRRW